MGLFAVLGSLSIWLAVYGLSSTFNAQFSKSFRSMPKMDRVEWSNRTSGTVHSFVSLFLAIAAVLKWPQDNATRLSTAVTSESELCVDVILGYYLADVILVLLNFQNMKRARVTLIHHVVTVFPFLVVSVYHQLHFYAIVCAFTEASTPFANMHWFLSKRGKRNTSLFHGNLILMTLAYLTFRVVTMPYFLVDFVLHFSEVRQHSDTVVWATAGVGAFLISLMSILWFVSLLATVREVFLPATADLKQAKTE